MSADPDTLRDADRAEADAFADFFRAAPRQFKAKVEVINGATLLVCPTFPLGTFNRVIGLGLDGPITGQTADAIIGRFEAAGATKFFVHAGAATDMSVRELFAARGLRPGDPPLWTRLVHRETTPIDKPTKLEVKPVTEAGGMAWAEAIRKAFQMPPLMSEWLTNMIGRDCWTCLGVFDGGRVIGGGLMWTDATRAWLAMGGVIPEARNRGAQGALLRARVEMARAAGAQLIATQTWTPKPETRNPSLDNLKRVGFVSIGERLNLQIPAPGFVKTDG